MSKRSSKRSSEGSRQRSRQHSARARVAAGAIVLLALGAGGTWAFLRTQEADGEDAWLRGVRLGMSPGQVRDRFEPGISGRYRSIMEGEDFALEWTVEEGAEPEDPSEAPPPRRALFEFHTGLLVAVRMDLASEDPAAEGPRVRARSATVLARDPRDEGGITLTLLARSCPTHAPEVARLLGGGS